MLSFVSPGLGALTCQKPGIGELTFLQTFTTQFLELQGRTLSIRLKHLHSEFFKQSKAQYFYSFKALYEASYEASQMCLVLITLCCKTKHLRSLGQDLLRGFE